jgi:hypothetical protein
MMQVEQGSRSDPSGRTVLKGAAAATMSLLMETKVPREQAARRVAAQLKRGGITFGDSRHSEPWQTVAGWRAQAVKAIKSKSEDSGLGLAYQDWLTELFVPPPADEQEREQFRRSILKTLLKATRYDDRA